MAKATNTILMKLIKMTDFITAQLESRNNIGKCWMNTTIYNQLLKTKVNLNMFLPCDKKGKASRPKPLVLAKGVFNYTKQNFWDEQNSETFEKILFEGDWEHTEDDRYIGMNWVSNGTITIPMHSVVTIEDLCEHNVVLKKGWEEKIKEKDLKH